MNGWGLILSGVNAVLLAGIFLLLILFERERKKREEWMEDQFIRFSDLLKQLQQGIQNLKSALEQADENSHKRYHYLKKSINDLLDQNDVAAETEKRVRDLYYQLERTNHKLDELRQILSRSPDGKNAKSPRPEPAPEVQTVLDLYQQGLPKPVIAQKVGRSVTEVDLILALFEDELKSV